jgi:N-acyl-D-amino-acid deacylase
VPEGFHADLVAFDPATIGINLAERVHDQPGGADRLVVRSTGIEHVWVNGVATRVAGEDVSDVAPGRLLRSGAGAGTG